MSNRNLPGASKLTLPERPSFMDNLSRKILDEADQLKFQREMMVHHIGMLETELRAARRMLQLIDEVRRVEKTKVEVTLAVFSGRRDPSWTLSRREVDELRKLLDRGLSSPVKKPKKRPGLGYSGFVIHSEAGIKGIPEKMDVYSGVITIVEPERGREKQTFYEDVNRIELWLAEQAVSYGHGDVLEHFGGPSMK
jgi:hypothetical protein